jgi:uncharacterized protein (TIGR02301 family)
MRSLLIVLAVMAAAPVAVAQDRSPVQRQALVDLAYVLGEAHALRQVCHGRQDQYWRDQMIGLVGAEQPDATMERRLRETFNTGFATRQGEFPACSPEAQRAEAAAMRRGRGLAGRLARAGGAPPPAPASDDVADRPGPR